MMSGVSDRIRVNHREASPNYHRMKGWGRINGLHPDRREGYRILYPRRDFLFSDPYAPFLIGPVVGLLLKSGTIRKVFVNLFEGVPLASSGDSSADKVHR